jgi:sugar phosphate isomerase/epimerase
MIHPRPIHPRLSISALSSFSWSFEEDLALWRDLGIKWAGLLSNKIAEDTDARLARLTDAGIAISTVIGSGFDLRKPESWDASRAVLHGLIDAVARQNGRSVYITPGRTTGAPWAEVLDVLAAAIAPSIDHARAKGVWLAFEPSLRTDVSFVNTLRDAIDVSQRTGLGIVVDFGNCWMERDFREVLQQAAPYIALVQICDVPIGEPGKHSPGGRVPFGEGSLPFRRMMRDVIDTGYDGPFEFEIPGPQGDAEGYEPIIRRGVAGASALLHELGL